MRIYFDENLSENAVEGLHFLCKSYFSDVEVFSTIKAIARGATDASIVIFVGAQDGVLVTRDNDFRKVQAIYQLCQEHKVPVVFLKLSKGRDGAWWMVKMLIKHWEEILERCRTLTKPFSITVSEKGTFKLMK